jgi:hypothetical protein
VKNWGLQRLVVCPYGRATEAHISPVCLYRPLRPALARLGRPHVAPFDTLSFFSFTQCLDLKKIDFKIPKF